MLAVSYCYCSDWVSAEERTVVFAYLQICGWVANIIAPMAVGNSKMTRCFLDSVVLAVSLT